jgi:hypothetical protein
VHIYVIAISFISTREVFENLMGLLGRVADSWLPKLQNTWYTVSPFDRDFHISTVHSNHTDSADPDILYLLRSA